MRNIVSKLFLLFLAFILSESIQNIQAQSPDQFKYQAVLRDAGGSIISGQSKAVTVNILKGSINGSAVFTEMHQITTSPEGMINLTIGSVSELNTINWADDNYYIEILVDGISLGTSQLLAVPYALFAKKAKTADYNDIIDKPAFSNVAFSGNYNDLLDQPLLFSGSYHDLFDKPEIFDGRWDNLFGKPDFASVAFTGSYNDLIDKPVLFSGNYNDLANKPVLFDGTWPSLTDKPLFANVAISGSYLDLSDKPTTDGSETKITAAANVSVIGDGTVLNPYIISTKEHFIGELYGGGIVFWVSQDGQHGLVMSLADVHSTVVWSNVDGTLVGNSYDLNDGLSNTNAIVSQPGHVSSAAQLCLDYSYQGFDDWYLPAAWQLSQIYNNAYTLNYVLENDGDNQSEGLATLSVFGPAPYPAYWSSTESNATCGTYLYIQGGQINADITATKSRIYRVRAVRNF